MKVMGIMVVLLGTSAVLGATVVAAPEIDPSSATTAIALVSGALLVFRGRRKK
jgi:hypothetical protein